MMGAKVKVAPGAFVTKTEQNIARREKFESNAVDFTTVASPRGDGMMSSR